MRIIVGLIVVVFSFYAHSGLLVSLKDERNGALIDLPGAVVWAIPKDEVLLTTPPRRANMEQRNRQFQPYILAVQQGAEVIFPNRDRTAHHVYSFSKPITFELPLYKKSTPKPVIFDKPGLVPLGCNIHDWMIGYILVLKTPYFSQLETSSLMLDQLPKGEYEVKLWHPAIDSGKSLTQGVQYDGASGAIIFSLKLPLLAASQPEAPAVYTDELEDY